MPRFTKDVILMLAQQKIEDLAAQHADIAREWAEVQGVDSVFMVVDSNGDVWVSTCDMEFMKQPNMGYWAAPLAKKKPKAVSRLVRVERTRMTHPAMAEFLKTEIVM